MAKLIAPLDVLFVFEQWTLMLRAEDAALLEPGLAIELYDEASARVGSARLGKFLSSRNPEVAPAEVIPANPSIEMKAVKFIGLSGS